MSIRTVPHILATAVFVAFGFPPANAQQKPQPPQSLRLYVLDCGIITPASVDNYGLKANHYPEKITYKKIPSFDTNKEQTAKSREMIEAFVKQNRAELWIQHDYTTGIKRRIAPEFYD